MKMIRYRTLLLIIVLGLAARGATSPLAQQLTSKEEEEALANLMLDLDGVQCPLSHPYAFKWGDKCCMFPREKEPPNDLPQFWNSVSDFCTGLTIRLSSHCCQDDAFISCPKAPCTSASLVTTTTPRVVDPDDFEIISVEPSPPIKSAVAFVPVASKTTTTTKRPTTRRSTFLDNNEKDFEIISIPLRSEDSASSSTKPRPRPPPALPTKEQRVSQRVTDGTGSGQHSGDRVIFPED